MSGGGGDVGGEPAVGAGCIDLGGARALRPHERRLWERVAVAQSAAGRLPTALFSEGNIRFARSRFEDFANVSRRNHTSNCCELAPTVTRVPILA